jgi:hypothetical protein
MINDTFTVIAGKPQWSGDFKKQFADLMKLDGKTFECTIDEIKDKAYHFQFKHYWGHLLPVLANECYDGILAKAHYELKKMFLLHEVTDWNQIPKKHYDRITILTHNTVSSTGESTEQIYGYIPSTSKLTKDEFREYITKVEWLIAEMGLHGTN